MNCIVVYFVAFWTNCSIFYAYDNFCFYANKWASWKAQSYNPIVWDLWKSCAISCFKMQALFFLGVAPFVKPSQYPLETIPVGALKFLALSLSYDFTFYICHRLMHAFPFLYKFHKQHHRNSVVLVAASASDSHFLGILVEYVPFFVIVEVFSFSETLRMIALVVIAVCQCWSHAGITAQAHTIHHEQRKYNYGIGLYCMDRCMGTFKAP